MSAGRTATVHLSLQQLGLHGCGADPECGLVALWQVFQDIRISDLPPFSTLALTIPARNKYALCAYIRGGRS